MSERWAGFDVAGDSVTAVIIEAGSSQPYTVLSDTTFRLDDGPRPAAYQTMFQRIRDFAKDGAIKIAVLKASAVPPKGRPTLALLRAAELRGVVAAASCEGGAETREVTRAAVNREFGNRDLGEYLKDDNYWSSATKGRPLRTGSRIAAVLVINEMTGT